jgi:hypothetical protein
MLHISKTGIPGITCGKCQDPVPLDTALVLKFPDLSSVVFVCVDCAEELKQKYPKAAFVLARTFFESLTAGNPRRVLQIGI